MGGSKDAAEDITQEVFVVLAQGRCRFDARLGTLSTYLYGIARNLVRRRLRRASLRPEVALTVLDEPAAAGGLPAACQDPVDRLERSEGLRLLRRAILALPFRHREVIVLCELNELTYEQAARVVGCPVGTVRSRLSRARRALSSRCRGMAPQGAGHAAERDCLADAG
jgi:RNA polymerase sigma-70 factor (ECF subfamily)